MAAPSIRQDLELSGAKLDKAGVTREPGPDFEAVRCEWQAAPVVDYVANNFGLFRHEPETRGGILLGSARTLEAVAG